MLSPEQEELRRVARAFVADSFPQQRIRTFEEAGSIPSAAWSEVHAASLLGIGVPVEEGGQGGGTTEIALVVEVMAEASLSLAMRYLASVYSGVHTIMRAGTPEQRREHIGAYLRGSAEFAFAFTEPSGGADVSGWNTSARKRGDHVVIHGSKTFCSNADSATWLLVAARTEVGARPHEGLSLFMVDPRARGITMSRIPTMGMRALGSFEVRFNQVAVPVDQIVGHQGRGFYEVLGSLDVERAMVAAAATGNAAAAVEDARGYALDRHAFGGPIGRFQAIQQLVADATCELDAARLLTWRATRLLDLGHPCQLEATMAKLFASEAGFRAAQAGMRILGGIGYSTDMNAERRMRDAQLFLTGPISSEMARNFIAERCGLPKSYGVRAGQPVGEGFEGRHETGGRHDT